MQLWTLQTEPNYDNLKKQKEIFSNTPSQLSPIVQEWFMKKTKFKQWPVWCWLSLPSRETIQAYCDKIHQKENVKTYLIELNIPNNEKMIFISEDAWHDVAKKPQIIHEEHHTIPLSKWDSIFNISSLNKKVERHPVRVCINKVHSHWVEQIYPLNPK